MCPRPVSYIDKSREYYAAQGYSEPYNWAHNASVPFTPLSKALSDCRAGIFTTSTPLTINDSTETNLILRSSKEAYAEPIDPAPSAMYTQDLSWDKEATHTRDVETFLPIKTLQALASEGLIHSVSDRFYGVPTEYSQRRTTDVDAPKLLRFCRDDQVDVAILVPL